MTKVNHKSIIFITINVHTEGDAVVLYDGYMKYIEIIVKQSN